MTFPNATDRTDALANSTPPMSAQDILDAVAARLDAAADRLEGCPATLRAVAAELRALVQELG